MFASGFLAGALGYALPTPLQLIKVQQQTDAGRLG
jgi:hypothetical protein